MLQIIEKTEQFKTKVAIKKEGKSYTFKQLLDKSESVASRLLGNKKTLDGARVAFMVDPSFEYVAVQWGIWRAGGVAVPLCISYPLPSLEYVLEDTAAEFVISDHKYEDLLSPLINSNTFKFIPISEINNSIIKELPDIIPSQNAMILYTSGTTNLPKGVVTTHANLEAQISTLVEAWKWTEKDHTLCVLPLHHVHGIINVVSCALWAGATVEFIDTFSAKAVFDSFFKREINVFMAVPTIYFKLIAYWEQQESSFRNEIYNLFSNFRLMVSGSAALPVSVMEKWKIISGHTLLERYGMTEIGMGISNPYEGDRKAGYIGQPLPGVSVRLVDESNNEVAISEPGEIQIMGKSVFKEYWKKPIATQEAFTEDGWFKTGDIAVIEEGYFRILGRDSIDIIKSGGYKISALEIEEVLRQHPEISDCAVVGIPDEEWGELVAAAIVTKENSIDLKMLNEWMRSKMPSYKTPRNYLIVSELPRNAMGKVTKNDIKPLFN